MQINLSKSGMGQMKVNSIERKDNIWFCYIKSHNLCRKWLKFRSSKAGYAFSSKIMPFAILFLSSWLRPVFAWRSSKRSDIFKNSSDGICLTSFFVFMSVTFTTVLSVSLSILKFKPIYCLLRASVRSLIRFSFISWTALETFLSPDFDSSYYTKISLTI